jgi:hypothetical protein
MMRVKIRKIEGGKQLSQIAIRHRFFVYFHDQVLLKPVPVAYWVQFARFETTAPH